MDNSLKLPDINTDLIAANISEQSPDVMATVYIMHGQYIVRYQDNQQKFSKFVSPDVIRAAFTQIPIDSGFLPSGTVRWGSYSQGNWVVKFIPPQQTSIFLADTSKPNALRIPLPGLVFLGIGYRYFLWAVKTREFEPQAGVFHAPFPNINADGSICFGSNRVPKCSSTTLESAWQLFLSSPFNGDSATGKSKLNPNDVQKQLRAITSKRRYPLRDLVPICTYSRLTIAQIIERTLKYP